MPEYLKIIFIFAQKELTTNWKLAILETNSIPKNKNKRRNNIF